LTLECDVLVVGAGPAGTVAALRCAKQGLDTVLLEKNSRVGGHTKTKLDASADSELSKIMDEMGLKDENTVFISNWHPPSGNYFRLKSESPEYFFKRGPDSDSFEADTVAKAKAAGCQVYLNSKIEEITETDGKIESLTVKINGGVEIITSRVVVAADGGNSMFHRFVTKKTEDRKKIGYGVSGKDFSDKDSSNVYFDAELMKGGYFYLITGESGVSTACIVLDSKHLEQKAEEAFNVFISNHPEISERIGSDAAPFYGEGRIFDLNTLVRGNLVFVGEAAGLLDPFFGYGMTTAIVSAYYAGASITQALKEGDLNLLNKYDSLMKEKFNKRMSDMYQRVFESLINDDLDLISNLLTGISEKTDINLLLQELSGLSD